TLRLGFCRSRTPYLLPDWPGVRRRSDPVDDAHPRDKVSRPRHRIIDRIPTLCKRTESVQLYLTKNRYSRPIWHAIYVLDLFCLVVSGYPIYRTQLAGQPVFKGYEEQLLDGIWMGLLGLETLIVLGIAMRTVSRKLKAPPKLKTT